MYYYLPETSIVKYVARLKFDVEGVIEKADAVGAIFGQTEGLFGPEMNLHELQKSWKVGRIEINLKSKNDVTEGEVLIPMSTDISTAALISAAVESIDKVGPCAAHFTLSEIEDVRSSKRRVIVERAKKIMKEWASKSISESENIVKDVADSTKRARITSFGKDNLPAGPGIYTSDHVFLVEGRADVVNLLRTGYENVVAIDGAKIPESIKRLMKEKKITAFLDGDRGGDLILKELEQVGKVQKVLRAPNGKEVEDLTPLEIDKIIKQSFVRPSVARTSVVKPKVKPKAVISIPADLSTKIKELFPKLNGTLEAVLIDANLKETDRIPVSQLYQKLESSNNATFIVFDGIITQRLVEAASQVKIKALVGHRTGDVRNVPSNLILNIFKDLGLS
mgnify:CR=1 FL=1